MKTNKTYEVTCEERDYYSMTLSDLTELKTMEYVSCDYCVDGFYHFEIGRIIKGQYKKLGRATALIVNCRAEQVEIQLSLS